VAVVTGANKGIGYALVKRLAEEGLTVILTARDFERGNKAAQALRTQGFHVHFFRLDVSDPASINAFVSWFKIQFGSLDILVSLTHTHTL
jgi:carbonyl reductase 1